MRGIRDLHEYWANIIQIGLSCWLLQRELGAAFAAPLVVVIVSATATAVVGAFLGPRQRAWMEAIQLRVSATANAITQMKLIKMSGMTEPVQSYIQRLRFSEIAIGGRWRMLIGIVATLLYLDPQRIDLCILLVCHLGVMHESSSTGVWRLVTRRRVFKTLNNRLQYDQETREM